MTSLGVQLSVGGSSVAAIVDAALEFEAAGFESVWVGSHFIDYYDPARTVPECLVTLAAVAQATSSIRVGSLAIPAVREHPSVLAQMAGTLADLSGDRFELGIGAGGTRDEFRSLGMPFPRRGGRVDQLEHALLVLRALRGGGPADLDAGELQLRDASCRPSFATTPLVVAALGQRTARLAGRLGDEVNTIDYAEHFDAADVVGRAFAEAERHGRTVRASIMVPPPQEAQIGGGAHPHAGIARAEELGASRLIYRVVPPYPRPVELLDVAHG